MFTCAHTVVRKIAVYFSIVKSANVFYMSTAEGTTQVRNWFMTVIHADLHTVRDCFQFLCFVSFHCADPRDVHQADVWWLAMPQDQRDLAGQPTQ